MSLANHLWQSTVFAAFAGLLAITLRRNRARVRHNVWLAASLKFLLPFSVLIALGSRVRWTAPRAGIPVVLDRVSQPFTAGTFSAPPQPAGFTLASLLLIVWACGFAAIAVSWWVRWRGIAARVRAGTPLQLDAPIRALASPGLTEPGVFGVFRPVLLLPAGIHERLTPPQLKAVLAHEIEHVRHRDNLTAMVHMFVETLFWFHPLVWWIGRRMVEERERACDEAVIGAGGQRRVYAEAILNVCKFYTESPLDCVSGVTGANLKKRIEGIMTKRIAGDLHIAKKVVLAIAAIATFSAPVVIGMLDAQPAPPLTFQSEAVVAIHEVQPAALPAPQPPTPPAPKPTFDNPAMSRIFRQYGAPDQKSSTAETEIWRYNSLADFRGSYAEFEFPTGKGRAGMRINWPPPLQTFPGETRADASTAAMAEALDAAANSPAEQLPGGHASMSIYPTKQNVVLSIPLNLLNGRVDVIGQISRQAATGERGPIAANFRDFLNSPSGSYQTFFVLDSGSYDCKLLVREQASGLIYTEEIPFQVK